MDRTRVTREQKLSNDNKWPRWSKDQMIHHPVLQKKRLQAHVCCSKVDFRSEVLVGLNFPAQQSLFEKGWQVLREVFHIKGQIQFLPFFQTNLWRHRTKCCFYLLGRFSFRTSGICLQAAVFVIFYDFCFFHVVNSILPNKAQVRQRIILLAYLV